jgi:hypothetical protein
MSALEHPLVARAAAVCVLLAAAAALWLGPVSAYLDLVGDDASQLDAARASLARDRALVQRAPGRENFASASILLADGSDAQTVAFLQDTLKQAAASAQVEIEGLQVLPQDALAGAARVGVRLRARGDIAGLDRLLYAIESSRPLLYPDNLHIQAGIAPGDAPVALEFQLDVSGFKAGAPS